MFHAFTTLDKNYKFLLVTFFVFV